MKYLILVLLAAPASWAMENSFVLQGRGGCQLMVDNFGFEHGRFFAEVRTSYAPAERVLLVARYGEMVSIDERGRPTRELAVLTRGPIGPGALYRAHRYEGLLVTDLKHKWKRILCSGLSPLAGDPK